MRFTVPIALFAFLASPLAAAAPQAPRPTPLPEQGAMRIERSVRIAPDEYLRAVTPAGVERPEAERDPAESCVLLAEDLRGATIDLRGVTLRGMRAGLPLERASGFGLVLKNCEDVTVLGGSFGGYRGCIAAWNCKRLRIEGASFDGYFGQRLSSTPAAEDPSDWLRPHDNDKGEWLAKYGAAISLSDCRDSSVSLCRARHGQNGLLLTRCAKVEVFDNDFSFLSGWGVALYRSSENVIAHNALDYCVRGYSHDVYWRGQDSAAILLFERCSDNVVAFNSATHSGDGLFLFAGQDIVEGRAFERGEADAGGSDRNLFYRNDFSYAVANGIEATFSRDNRAIENVIRGCRQHGVWGGYSSRMLLVGNEIEESLGGGITIEHGQECWIARNVLHGNEIGLELYWDEDPELVGGPFGKRFDTSSREHAVLGNSFARNDLDLVVLQTGGLSLADNVFEPDAGELEIEELAWAGEKPEGASAPAEILRGVAGWKPSGRIASSSLRAADARLSPELEEAFYLEPPEVPGTLQAVDAGATSTRGSEGLEGIVIGEWGPWDFRSGEPRPAARAPGGALARARWSATWFSWKDGPDPRGAAKDQARWRALAEAPLAAGEVAGWSSPWGDDGVVRERVGNERFGLIASTAAELAGGEYVVRITSDDGVRLAVDGRTVLENWTWHAATRDEARIALRAGEHAFVLEYFQIDGGAALTVDLLPAPE